MGNGRCRLHGGKSTGPRTPEGLARLAAAHTTHGGYNAMAKALDRYNWTLKGRTRVAGAVLVVQAYLPRDLAARLDDAPELWVPAPPTSAAYAVVADNSPCNVGRGSRGRFVASARPPVRGRAADREYALAEAAALAPWKAGIARALMARGLVLAGRRAVTGRENAQRPHTG
jgi:hypothetical protein